MPTSYPPLVEIEVDPDVAASTLRKFHQLAVSVASTIPHCPDRERAIRLILEAEEAAVSAVSTDA